jgi:hypothetical protein
MERLTQKTPDSEMVWFKDKERLFEPCEMSAHQSRMAIAKLAAYEQDEEQGLLLRLPCKVGDTLYEVSYENRKYIICEHIVNQFVYIAYRKPRIEIYCEGENGFLSSSITGQLDDGLFLNREEAEAKLKEMEGAK